MSSPPGERIAALEVKTEAHAEEIKAHAEHLETLDKTLTALVSEVKSIRNALYFMATALAANVPALQHLASTVAAIFGF